MAKIKVKLIAHFSSLKGFESGNIEVYKDLEEGADVREVLTDLAEEYGETFKTVIYNPETDDLSELLLVAVNGYLLHSLEGLDTKLHQGDVIGIHPIPHGG